MERHGVFRVTSVGDNTEQGKVFEAAQIDDRVKTPLNEQLDGLSDWITKVSYGFSTLIIIERIIAFFVTNGTDYLGSWEQFFQKRLKALSAKVEQEGIVLDENQVAALEKAKEEKQAHGEIETYYPGFLLAQDTYYVGYIKGVGHIYQQTVIDTYSKIGFAKLYDRKNALVAADMLNDRVIPFFEQHDLKLMRMLTDRGTEYCGNRENHEYELYLAVEDIDHSKIKAKSPQTNGICERFNRTVQNEFYAIAFRKKIYTSIEQLQADLDTWMNSYNTQRTHSGKYCFGKTPTQTFIEGIAVARKYQLQNLEMMAHPINLGD